MRGAGRSAPVSIGDGSQFSKRCFFKPIVSPILKTLMRRASRRPNGSGGCGRKTSTGARAERVEHGSPSQRSFETPILETLARGVGRRANGPIETPVLKTLMRGAGRRPNGSGGFGRKASTGARAERVEHGGSSQRSIKTPILETLARGVGSCGAPTAHYGQTGFGQAGARVGARRRTGGASRSAEEEQHRQEELERRGA